MSFLGEELILTSSSRSSVARWRGIRQQFCKQIMSSNPGLFLNSFQMVQAFTHAHAALEADKGGKFQLLDGSVTGEFVDLVSTN